MLRIDLGCGTNKQNGFIGLDRLPLPGVDIVADINCPLPFPDDSVDLLFASHSLEHASDLLSTMKEVYRICKHRAQLCILAPYSEQKINWANPYHFAMFNEHTPRFWTPYPISTLEPDDFAHPHAGVWGLSRSDNSDPGIDIRLVRIEYFYFPEYIGLPPAEQRRLRKERVDVCDQIMYNLVVWKAPWEGTDEAFHAYAAEIPLFSPEFIQARRNLERDELLRRANTELEAARARISQLQQQAHAAVSERIEELLSDRDRAQNLLLELRLHNQQQSLSLTAALDENLNLRHQLIEARSEVVCGKGEIARLTDLQARSAEEVQQQSLSLTAALDENLNLRNQLIEARSEMVCGKGEIARLTDLQARSAEEISLLRKHEAALQAELSLLRNALQPVENLRAQLALTKAELETTATLLELRTQETQAAASALAQTQATQSSQPKQPSGQGRTRVLEVLSLQVQDAYRKGGMRFLLFKLITRFPAAVALFVSARVWS
jgi:SAM-dependent methyltransferase